MSDRERKIGDWLDAVIGGGDYTIEPASGDASFRRYFRVTLRDGEQQILMDAPPSHEDCRPFLDVTERLLAIGLHVPAVYAQSTEQGFLLLEDLGTEHYLDRLDAQSAGRLYGDALGALVTMQACGSDKGLPVYDETLLRTEMSLFPDWLVVEHLGMTLSDSEQAGLASVSDLLVESALEQPRVIVHRDYHSRNLLLTHRHNPGIIDFQDAVSGPVTYDLVSLLKDCYIQWPQDQVEQWVRGYFDLALQSGVVRDEHEGSFLRWFDLMGVQRHLKAAGIFARLYRRDGKPGYLGDIPRTLSYITALAGRYSELESLVVLIDSRILLALARSK